MRQELPFILQDADVSREGYRQVSGEGEARILFTLEGCVTAVVNQRRSTLRINDYLLLGPEDRARMTAAGEGLSRVTLLRMDPAFLAGAGVAGENLLDVFSPERLEKNRFVSSQHNTNLLIRSFFQNLRRGAELPMGVSYCHHLLALLSIIAGRSAAAQMPAAEGRGQHTLSINAVYYYVRDHLSEDLSLDVLAEKLYFNKYYIAHAFKRETGMSLHQYISEKRLERARELLLMGTPVHRAAAACGYADDAHFVRSFKQKYGLPPKKYCRLHGERGEETPLPPDRETGSE